jgi:hypothetical protein
VTVRFVVDEAAHKLVLPDLLRFYPASPPLRVFENRVLRRIFGPRRDEVRGGWRKLQNEELRTSNLFLSPSQGG